MLKLFFGLENETIDLNEKEFGQENETIDLNSAKHVGLHSFGIIYQTGNDFDKTNIRRHP